MGAHETHLSIGASESLGNVIDYVVLSIPIQRLQGFCPSICFLACKSKISLWAQFKTRRDGNLVNVEWELTVGTDNSKERGALNGP